MNRLRPWGTRRLFVEGDKRDIGIHVNAEGNGGAKIPENKKLFGSKGEVSGFIEGSRVIIGGEANTTKNSDRVTDDMCNSSETGGTSKVTEKRSVRKVSHEVGLLEVYAVDFASRTRVDEIERGLRAKAEVHGGAASWSKEDVNVIIIFLVSSFQFLDQCLKVALGA